MDEAEASDRATLRPPLRRVYARVTLVPLLFSSSAPLLQLRATAPLCADFAVLTSSGTTAYVPPLHSSQVNNIFACHNQPPLPSSNPTPRRHLPNPPLNPHLLQLVTLERQEDLGRLDVFLHQFDKIQDRLGCHVGEESLD